MRCSNCGSEINDGKFCFNCGENIDISKFETETQKNEEQKTNKKSCGSKIGLWICGSFFILIAVAFFFWSASENVKGIIIFTGVVGCIINAVLFFALGDIAQKVTEMYQNKNSN